MLKSERTFQIFFSPVYIHPLAYVHTYLNICTINTYIYVYIYVYVYAYFYMYIMYLCIYMHLNICKSMIGAAPFYIYLHTDIYAYIYIAHMNDLDYLLYMRYVFFR